MKVKYVNLLLLVLLLVMLVACEDKDEDKNKKQRADNQYVNNWIYQNMDFYYYWRDKMSSERTLDKTISPSDFFDKLLFPYNKTTYEGDRFSWIQPSYVDLLNSLSGVSSKEIGFDFIPYLRQEGKSDVMFYVTYIKKGTNAEKSNLKRGHVITKVNGVELNDKNWSSALYQNAAEYKLEGLNFSGAITVQPTGNYSENPIYLDSIYTDNKGKEAGYIVYNQFTMDNADGSYKYDKQLAKIFSKFNDRNITTLILDLRYNGGGYETCALNIASALVPGRNSTSKLFAYKEFNPVFTSYAKQELGRNYNSFVNSYFKENIEVQDSKGNITVSDFIPKYGDKIEKLYILVGRNTASASELVINGLYPYMGDKIVLIGERTYGKNVGSFSLYEENDSRNRWGMQPIVSKTYNSENKSEYAMGFTPDFIVDDFTGIENGLLYSLGDENETLLNFALAKAGIKSQKKTVKTKPATMKSIGWSRALKSGTYDLIINDNRIQQLIDSKLQY